MYEDNDGSNPASMETVIREGLIARYGEVYTKLILDGWKVICSDAGSIEICAFSDFQAQIIRTRLLPDIKEIVGEGYAELPDISVIRNRYVY